MISPIKSGITKLLASCVTNEESLDPLCTDESRIISSGKFVEAILESLIRRNDWPKVDEYLMKIVYKNFLDSISAVSGVPSGEINQAHPELALLPRQQHAYDLLLEGKYDEASDYYNENLAMLEKCRSKRVRAASSELKHHISNRTQAVNNDVDTGIAIKDYIYLYYPILRPDIRKRKCGRKPHEPWDFAWREGSGGFRCFACHKVFRRKPLGLVMIEAHFFFSRIRFAYLCIKKGRCQMALQLVQN
uniref:Uncharacterized protein n=1 Tax=Leersia perrieri TaxID=77586 RepID=A0A0D9WHJ6_9ORYZ